MSLMQTTTCTLHFSLRISLESSIIRRGTQLPFDRWSRVLDPDKLPGRTIVQASLQKAQEMAVSLLQN